MIVIPSQQRRVKAGWVNRNIRVDLVLRPVEY